MKKRKTILAIFAAGCLFILSGTTALAQGPGPGMGFGMGPGIIPLRALMKLGLTDAQKAEIANIYLASKTEMATAEKKHEEIRNIMKPVLKADAFNEANIRAAIQKSALLMADIMVVNARITSQVRSVLTAEQRQALCDGRKDGRKKMPLPPVFDEMQEEVLKAWGAKTATE